MWLKQCRWALIFLYLCLLLLVPVSANEQVDSEERQLLRVGYVYEATYFHKNDDGEYRGYIPELLYHIAMHGNFKLEIVEFPNYAEEDQALLDGTIDMEAVVPRAPEWEAKFAFSDTPTSHAFLSLAVDEADARYEYGDITNVNRMRIAIVTSDASSGYFQTWCQKNNLYPQLQFYPDFYSATAAVHQGAADGVIINNEIAPGCRIMLHFADISCYAMFNKHNLDLKTRFDSALNQLLLSHPMYEQQLYYEYITPDSNRKMTFSHQEKDFLRHHKTLTIALQEFSPPFSYKDAQGNLQGILPSYYEKLGQEMDVQFTYKFYPTEVAAQEAVLQGQADILGLYSDSLQLAYKTGLRLIEISHDRTFVRIAAFDTNEMKKAAILARDESILKDKLSAQQYDIKTFDNIDECYAALKKGNADCIICGNYMATWLFNNHRLDGYGSAPMEVSNSLYFAILPTDNTFYSVLNKNARIVNAQFKSIIAANVMPQEGFRNLIDRLPLWGLSIFAFSMTALVFLLAVLIVVLRRHYQERALLATRESENEKEKIRLESLKRSADEKNMFFSNISHDMRTPLNAILGYAQLAGKQPLPTVLRDYLAKISLSGNLLLNLINDTLLVSKISSNKLEIQREPVHTNELNQALTATITTAAAERGVLFSMDDTGLRARTVLADKLKLQKILLNLLSNAVKFTPPGRHVWYTIMDEPAGAADPDMIFIIRDEGIGMSDEYQQELYTPFAQEKRGGYESQGTGLGLSIVKQLVDLLDGSISVQSTIGQGTTFTVRLHLPEFAAKTIPAATAASGSSLGQLAGKRILLCEDNELNAEIAIELLKGKSLSTDWAKNGQEGIDTFCSTPPGTYIAILMDLRMPVLNGFEATEKLRHLDRLDAQVIPIIAMTADAFEEDVKKCLDAGMNGHIAKPIDLNVLYETLEKVMAETSPSSISL